MVKKLNKQELVIWEQATKPLVDDDALTRSLKEKAREAGPDSALGRRITTSQTDMKRFAIQIDEKLIFALVKGHTTPMQPYSTDFPEDATMLAMWPDPMALVLNLLFEAPATSVMPPSIGAVVNVPGLGDVPLYRVTATTIYSDVANTDEMTEFEALPKYEVTEKTVKPRKAKSDRVATTSSDREALKEALESGENLDVFRIG
jgi:hypothetical protein